MSASFGAQVGAIVRKDLLLEKRRREIVVGTWVFALLVLVVFDFALDLEPRARRAAGPGVLWVAVFFAGALNVGRTVVLEKERGAWEGLLLSPLAPGALYAAKLAGNVLFMLLVEAALLPAFAAMYNLRVITPGVVLIVVLGTVGFAAVGTLFSALSANSRAREALLPVLLFPILLPVVIGAVKATGQQLAPVSTPQPPWVALLVAFDALFVIAGYLLFDQVVEE